MKRKPAEVRMKRKDEEEKTQYKSLKTELKKV